MFRSYMAILRYIICRKLFHCTVFLADKALIWKLSTVKIMMKIEVDN
jgi:hypothetical protein